MFALAIVTFLAGTVLYWTKIALLGFILKSIEELPDVWYWRWIKWLPTWVHETTPGAITLDIGIGLLAGAGVSIAGGITAMLIMIWFGGWSILYIKTRHTVRRAKRWWWKKREGFKEIWA